RSSVKGRLPAGPAAVVWTSRRPGSVSRSEARSAGSVVMGPSWCVIGGGTTFYYINWPMVPWPRPKQLVWFLHLTLSTLAEHLAAGCLLYSLVLRYERSPLLREITSSYVYILERVAAALSGIRPGAEQAGTSDLAAEGLKFSGNAQQRKRDYLLHHGTLLYNF